MGSNIKYLILVFLISVIDCLANIPFRVYPLDGSSSLNWTLNIVITDINRPFVYEIASGPDINIRTDYGDGSVSNYNSNGYKNHYYDSTGSKKIKIKGSVNNGYIRFGYLYLTGINPDSQTNLAWSAATVITNVPEVYTLTKVTNLYGTWANNWKVTNFPAVSTLTNAVTLQETWLSSYSATSYPSVNTLTNVVRLDGTWADSRLGQEFPDVSTLTSVTNLNGTWSNCVTAISFPPVSTLTNVTSMQFAWYNCTNAITLPAVNTLTNLLNINYAWAKCKANSFPDVSNLTKCTNLIGTWSNCYQATTMPDINTLTNVTSLQNTWANCTNLITPPSITAITNVTTIQGAWINCTNMTTFPSIFSSSERLTNVRYAFQRCTNIVGAAPELWNTDNFPNISLYTDCFDGLDPAKISNWNDIPASWK